MEMNTVSEEKNKTGLPVWAYVVAFVVLIGFLGLLGWGLIRAQKGGILPGDPAPNFTLTTYDGQTINLADTKGKVVMINFWASWCTTCADEAAFLENAWKHYEPDGKVVFLGIAWVDTPDGSMQYLQRFGITYPNGDDQGGEASQKYRITGVPETYFIDRQGKIATVQIGPFVSEDAIYNVVDGLLK